MSRYSTNTRVRISQKQHTDLVADGSTWWHKAGYAFPDLLAALQWHGLAASRRKYTPHDQPFCPLLDTRTGAPGEVELAAVRTFVYTAAATGLRGEVYESRRRRMAAILTAYGVQHWSFVWGSSCIPYCARHCADHARLMREHDPPILVFEDDAEPAFAGSHLVPPPEAKRLHIGGNRDGISLGRLLALKSGEDWRHYRGFVYKPCNRNWFRQAGMLATHCNLYLDKPTMLEIAEYIVSRSGAIDASIAELDWKIPAFAPTRCWWWQNDGHNGECTSEFVPPELRI